MNVQSVNIGIVDTGATVSVTLPDYRLTGSLHTDDSADTTLYDFNSGSMGEIDGQGSNIFKLINAMMSDPVRRAAVVTLLQDASIPLAKTYAGLQGQ